MHWIDAIGYLGALLTIGTYSMKTMIPLRVSGICANLVFITWGIAGNIYPSIFLHAVLLPLNAVRLYQMLQLTEKVKVARSKLMRNTLVSECSNGESLRTSFSRRADHVAGHAGRRAA